MKRVASNILSRFPERRKAIVSARKHYASFDELCRDYDAVIDAISAMTRRWELKAQFDALHRNLLDLLNNLEKEVLDQLPE